MSERFDAEWLMLREAADRAARNDSLQGTLAELLPARDAGPSVFDLGAGTGANLRALASELGPGQRWTLLDHDAELLARACSTLKQWCRDAGGTVREGDEDLHMESPGWDVRVRLRHCNLSGEGLAALSPAGLVTGSALLDLVSADWLRRLADTFPGAVLYFPLNYDGVMEFAPALDLDAEICALFNRHQTGDKGFGPALGGDAPRQAEEILNTAGFLCESAASPWKLGAGDVLLQSELIRGIAAAAGELSERKAVVETWRRQRMAFVEQGRGTAWIGHRDLLAVPAGGTP